MYHCLIGRLCVIANQFLWTSKSVERLRKGMFSLRKSNIPCRFRNVSNYTYYAGNNSSFMQDIKIVEITIILCEINVRIDTYLYLKAALLRNKLA